MRILKKISNKDLIIISKNIAELYEDGIHMLNIFTLLMDLPLNQSYKSSIGNMSSDIRDGCSLTEAFKNNKELYPKFFIEMIALGEKSGRLGEVLVSLSEYYKRKDSINKNIINSLIYPLFIMGVIIALILVFIFFILPNFNSMYESMNIEKPTLIRVCWNLNNLVKNNPIKVLSILICWAVIPTVFIIKKFSKRVEKQFEKIKIVRKVSEYKILTTLSILLKSGVNISLGIDFCIDSLGKGIVTDKLEAIKEAIYKGEALSDVFKNINIFSNYTLAMIKLGEESGNMEERLENRIKKIEEEIKTTTERMMSYFQPILIIILASVVIIGVFTIVVPLFNSIMGSVG